MKKFILASLISVCPAILFARESFNGQGNTPVVGRPYSYVNEGVNLSSSAVQGSATISSISVTFGSIDIGSVISTFTAMMFCVNITSAGVGSKLEIFDSSISTSAASIRKIDTIDTTTKETYFYNVFLSSGLAINNSSFTATGIAAGYSILWREK